MLSCTERGTLLVGWTGFIKLKLEEENRMNDSLYPLSNLFFICLISTGEGQIMYLPLVDGVELFKRKH